MTAPLALFLTQFSPAPAAEPSAPLDTMPSMDLMDPMGSLGAMDSMDPPESMDSMSSMNAMDLMGSMDSMEMPRDLPEPESVVTMTASELEAHVAAAAQEARSAAEGQHAAELASLTTAHEEGTAQALAAARAKWAEAAGEKLATSLETAIVELRNVLAARIADVLRPFIANAVAERTKADLIEVIDRLLSDPSQPFISIRGPKDLGAALRAARPDARIEWVATKKSDVTIIADATRVETKLAAALAEIAATEA